MTGESNLAFRTKIISTQVQHFKCPHKFWIRHRSFFVYFCYEKPKVYLVIRKTASQFRQIFKRGIRLMNDFPCFRVFVFYSVLFTLSLHETMFMVRN